MAVPVLAGLCTSGAGVSGMAGVVDGSSTKTSMYSYEACMLLSICSRFITVPVCVVKKCFCFEVKYCCLPFSAQLPRQWGFRGLLTLFPPTSLGCNAQYPPFQHPSSCPCKGCSIGEYSPIQPQRQAGMMSSPLTGLDSNFLNRGAIKSLNFSPASDAWIEHGGHCAGAGAVTSPGFCVILAKLVRRFAKTAGVVQVPRLVAALHTSL